MSGGNGGGGGGGGGGGESMCVCLRVLEQCCEPCHVAFRLLCRCALTKGQTWYLITCTAPSSFLNDLYDTNLIWGYCGGTLEDVTLKLIHRDS